MIHVLKRLLIASFVCLHCSLSQASMFRGKSRLTDHSKSTDQTQSKEFKVAYFNIDAIDSGSKWYPKSGAYEYPAFEFRLAFIKEAIYEQSPAIVAFSEAAFDKGSLKTLSQRMASIDYTHYSTVPGKLGKASTFFANLTKSILPTAAVYRNSGLVIFVQDGHSISWCKELVFKNKSGRDLVTNKGALLCKVRMNNNPKTSLYVSIAHFQAGDYEGFFASEQSARSGQMRELVKFLAHEVPNIKEANLIMGGDFNFDFGSEEHTLFDSYLRTSFVAKNLHTKNLNGRSRPAYQTYNGWNVIIDHVYASQNIFKNLSLEVVKVGKGRFLGSDHKMIVISGSL